MIDKTRGSFKDRPFYPVDPNANITPGMIAFLATDAAGTAVATTAASGDVPIGTFWGAHATGYFRSTINSLTFNAAGIITVSGGNILSTASLKVTNSAGTVTYTNGVDFTVNTTNGVITRLAGGSIAALATVVVWYVYSLNVNQVHWDQAGTRFSSGVNYDRQPDDTLARGMITVVTGNATLFTDMFDPTQTYTLNAPLYPDDNSLWSTAVHATHPICGRVVHVPTASDPYLGIDQIRVAP